VAQSERLGVSRTPVREALGRLLADGLVEASGGRGLVVTDVSEGDVDAIFEMRACLEAQSAQLAAKRCDPEIFAEFAEDFRASQRTLLTPGLTEEQIADYYALIRRFDTAVNTAAGNPFLVDAFESLRTHADRVRRKASASPERLAASAAEHALIAAAICAHDGALAVHATHVHLHNSLEHFRHDIAQLGDAG
jgi:DNA-binding GntR family transcriptional regulator